MAIKVKHEGSVASRMAASAEGGRAKRAMEAATLVKPTPIQTLQPAHASAPGASAPHAQLIGAPGGGAHAPLVGGGSGIGTVGGVGRGSRGSGSSSSGGRSGGSGALGDGDYKVTGTDRFHRPDNESTRVWDNGGVGSSGRWIRKWLPGEKEAEALDRVGTVRNEQRKDIESFLHGLTKDRAEQSSLLATERNIMGARLNAPPRLTLPAIETPFSSAAGVTEVQETPKKPKRSKVSITPASTESPELQNTLSNISPALLKTREEFENLGIGASFDNAMSVALATIADNDGGRSKEFERGTGTLGELFDTIIAQRGGAAPSGADDARLIAGQEEAGRSGLRWMDVAPNEDAMAGGVDSIAMTDYSDKLGGMIDMLLPR